MLETTLRVVEPGVQVVISVRRMLAAGSHMGPELLERACNRLRFRHGVAAVVAFTDEPAVMAATNRVLPVLSIGDDEWEISVRDAGEEFTPLTLAHTMGAEWLPVLVERAFLARLQRAGDLWTLNSPRIWYEATPFMSDGPVIAFRRYEVGAMLLEGVGVGVTVDVGTAFFANHTLDYYLDPNGTVSGRSGRRAELDTLLGRQAGQKGTLHYFARGHRTCYFEDPPPGITCGQTGVIKVKGVKYPSLTSFYAAVSPSLSVRDDELAVRVSFPGMDLPAWVAARFVRPRVMNDFLPEKLRNVDKIPPARRRSLLEGFWARLGPAPLGEVASGFQPGFWRPSGDRVRCIVPVPVEFGGHRRVAQPSQATPVLYKRYYRERLRALQESGCYLAPPSLSRVIHVVHPRGLGDAVVTEFSNALATQISQWVGPSFSTNLIQYGSLQDGIEQVRRSAEPGVVVFVISEEPAAYHEVAFQLEGWRIKRITQTELVAHAHALEHGAWDKRDSAVTSEAGKKKWQAFITMNALDIVQQMDVVPWRIDGAGPFEAQLVIDVGHDRRHVALSLLIARQESKIPSFGVYTVTEPKPDPKHEAINPTLLADQIVKVASAARRRRFDPIESLLVMRDGRLVGNDVPGIHRGLGQLREDGLLATGARISIVEMHKSTLKPIRAWEVGPSGEVTNVLENTVVELTSTMAMVATTGMATLHQGTADPLILVSKGQDSNLVSAAESVCASVQLNWSNPGAAQRLPLPFKRTDEELKARSAQEIRRLR